MQNFKKIYQIKKNNLQNRINTIKIKLRKQLLYKLDQEINKQKKI